MPPAIPLIIAGIQAAIQAAPQIEEVVLKAKELITSLFTAGVITADQQNQLHAHIDQHAADVAAGRTPVAWTVEPDPVMPTPVSPVLSSPTPVTQPPATTVDCSPSEPTA